ncbi:MAG: hypothetical protein ABIK25_07075 [Pseudomonadota bacterium]
MMVDLGDRIGNGRHRFEKFRWKREIENENRVAGNVGQRPCFAMMHRPIGGRVAEMAPGSIGGAKSIQAVGVVENSNRSLSRHAQ